MFRVSLFKLVAVGTFMTCSTLTFGASLKRNGLALSAPHEARRSEAQLDTSLQKEIDQAVNDAGIASGATIDQLIQLSLSITASHLRFKLSHPTNISFSVFAREANSTEYATLFASVFERVSRASSIKASAYVVHSSKLSAFRLPLPLGAGSLSSWANVTNWATWATWDWALVETVGAGGRSRYFIDPVLFDAHLPWDIRENVRGDVNRP